MTHVTAGALLIATVAMLLVLLPKVAKPSCTMSEVYYVKPR